MAQTKKKRRRKHRGTQGGRIDRRPARGRARSRAEAKARARSRGKKQRTGPREPASPSWRSATIKGAAGSVIFFGLLTLFGQPPLASLSFAILILAFYIPT